MKFTKIQVDEMIRYLYEISDTAGDHHMVASQMLAELYRQAITMPSTNKQPTRMAEKYPQYYKDVRDLTEMDVYATHHVFGLIDTSGCLHHASKKILLSGVRTGGKDKFKDIMEARDTLTRWLQIHGGE